MDSSSHNLELEIVKNANTVIDVINELKHLNLLENDKNRLITWLHAVIELLMDCFPNSSITNPLIILHSTDERFKHFNSVHLIPNLNTLEKNLAAVLKILNSNKMIGTSSPKQLVDKVEIMRKCISNAIQATQKLQPDYSDPGASIEPSTTQLHKSATTQFKESNVNKSPNSLISMVPEDPNSPISMLPEESLLQIMSFLRPKDISSLSRVASIYHLLGEDDPLWKEFLERDFKLSGDEIDNLIGIHGSPKSVWINRAIETKIQSYMVIKSGHLQADPRSLLSLNDRKFDQDNTLIGIYASEKEAKQEAEKNSKHAKSTAVYYICGMSEKPPQIVQNIMQIYRTDFAMNIAQYDTNNKILHPAIAVKLPGGEIATEPSTKESPKKKI